MPLDFTGARPTITFTIEDYNGDSATTQVTLPATATVAEIVAQAAALEAIFAGLTDGFITAATVNLRAVQTDDPGVGPPLGSQIGRKGVFSFLTDEGTTATYEVPSVDRTLVSRGSKTIDIAQLPVAAYEGFMTDGIVGITGGPVTQAGIGLLRLRRAYERGDDEGRSR